MSGKIRKEDRRTQYTKQLIKDTMLKLMAKKEFSKVTVTEICKLAEINRGTFYLHYYDTEDVLDDVIAEMICDTSSVFDHVLGKRKCTANCSYPFCEKVHSNDRYQVLFLDDSISSKMIEKISDLTKESYVTWLMSHSLLTFEEAEAIFYFQMNGCLNINKLMLHNHCDDWRKIQKVIDQFIKSGLEAFLIHDQRDTAL